MFKNKTWTTKYFLTAVCLICGTQVAVLKDYNLNHHYTTKHEYKYRNISEKEHASESDALLAKLQTEQGLFNKLQTTKEKQPFAQVM